MDDAFQVPQHSIITADGYSQAGHCVEKCFAFFERGTRRTMIYGSNVSTVPAR